MSKKPEMIAREKRIVELLSKGTRPADIFRVLASEFGITEKAAEKQYQRLAADQYENNEEYRQQAKLTTDTWLRKAYALAEAKGQGKTMIDAAKELARLHGVYDTDSQEAAQPKIIRIKTADFSQPLKAVGEGKDGK